MIREPVVAGQFYTEDPQRLRREVGSLLGKEVKREVVLGAVCPHAGYMFSGPVAGAVYSRIEIPDRLVILGPNHTGRGSPFSITTEGSWATPLGKVRVDSSLGKKILDNSRYLEEDIEAHAFEHSIEVQLPFIQYINPKASFVPLCLSSSSYNSYEDIASSIAKAIRDTGEEVLIIASSDMTHYESQTSAKEKDKKAIDAILKLDERLLLERIRRFNISMCGYIPTIIMLIACKQLGAKEAKLVMYQTSGDVIGDYSQVVGYAGLVVL